MATWQPDDIHLGIETDLALDCFFVLVELCDIGDEFRSLQLECRNLALRSSKPLLGNLSSSVLDSSMVEDLPSCLFCLFANGLSLDPGVGFSYELVVCSDE